MKRALPFLFLFFILASCKNNEETTSAPENDIDAAREFIRAALDGRFDQARKYLLPDSLNAQFLDAAERSYQRYDNATRNGYKSASINIHKVESVNDSTTIVIFSNSFKNDHDSLKILRWQGQWLVDLKYLYQHSLDTMRFNNQDSLR